MAIAQEPVRAHVHWGMKALAAIAIIFVPFLVFSFWISGVPVMSLLLLAYWVLAVWVFLLADTKIDVDEQGIWLTAPHGVYRMDWSEIRSVEFKGQMAYFFGDHKVIGYNLLFAGKGKRELREYVAQAIQRHKIAAGRPVGLKNSSVGPMLKNARVRGWQLFG